VTKGTEHEVLPCIATTNLERPMEGRTGCAGCSRHRRAEDPDYARKVNGVGFSRSDSVKGHTLAHLSVQSVLEDEATISEVLKMAARYRRQASRLL